MAKEWNPCYSKYCDQKNYLQDRIPARILRFVIGDETAGGEKEQEKNKNTSAFHLKKRKYFLCWAQNYFKREKKAHLAFTWQPHSPFKWNTQTFSLKIFNYAFSASILGQLKDDINTIDTILIYWNKMKNTPRIFVGHALGNHWCCFILLKWDV